MKTTKEHYELFKAECIKWNDAFGLKDWDVCFSHDDRGTLATCYSNAMTMRCELNLSTEWVGYEEGDITDEEIKRVALHEVCHQLFAELTDMVLKRIATEEAQLKEEHRIIRRLGKVLI